MMFGLHGMILGYCRAWREMKDTQRLQVAGRLFTDGATCRSRYMVHELKMTFEILDRRYRVLENV